MDDPIIQLAAILLLPLMPAFVLYRTLPSTANVEGPFGRLGVRFTGAFGGYIVLVMLALGFMQTRPAVTEETLPLYFTYEIEGLFTVEGLADQGNLRDEVEVVLRPTALIESDANDVHRYLVRLPAELVNGQVRLPVNRLQFRVRTPERTYAAPIDFRDVDLPVPHLSDVMDRQSISARQGYDVRLVVDPPEHASAPQQE